MTQSKIGPIAISLIFAILHDFEVFSKFLEIKRYFEGKVLLKLNKASHMMLISRKIDCDLMSTALQEVFLEACTTVST